VNVIIIVLICSILELVFRVIFPEFIGQIHTESISNGKAYLHSDFRGITVRVPYKEFKYNNNIPTILILGDSVSDGYGTAHEDIYWRKFERLINLGQDNKVQVISLSGYGNDLSDSVVNLKKILIGKENNFPVKIIIYQFNFNDITPFNETSIKTGDHLVGFEHTDLFKKFQLLRYRYLNKSVFARVMQHYAGRIKFKRYGTCESRGYDALYGYTWTFGSKPFKAQSERLWQQFEISLEKLKQLSDKLNSKCFIFISPLLFDIDTKGIHSYYSTFKYDFSCATINPRERLLKIANRLNIGIIDPKDYLKEHFEERIKEGNFEPFYFTADDNHFTPIASQYVAEYLYQNLKNSNR
jgi:lysophospholipase L1-like esterase